MSLSYEQLTEILLEAGPKFTIEKSVPMGHMKFTADMT